MKRTIYIILAAVVALVLSVGVMTACGNSHSSSGKSDSYRDVEGVEVEGGYAVSEGDYGYDTSTNDSDTSTQNGQKETKIIHTASLSMETKEFQKTMDAIIELVEKSDNAYFEQKSVSSYAGDLKTATMTIRVPSANLDSFMKELSGFGTVVSERTNAEDVSDDYYDIEARLNTAQIKLERLQALLEQAEDMADIITLEDAISDVEYEIDSLKGSLNYYDSKVDYSTIYLDVDEVRDITNTNVPISFGERISNAFSNSLSGFGSAMENVAVFIAEGWIWLLIFVVLPLIVLWIILAHFKKKRRQRKAAQEAEQQRIEEEMKDMEEVEESSEEEIR